MLVIPPSKLPRHQESAAVRTSYLLVRLLREAPTANMTTFIPTLVNIRQEEAWVLLDLNSNVCGDSAAFLCETK